MQFYFIMVNMIYKVVWLIILASTLNNLYEWFLASNTYITTSNTNETLMKYVNAK